MIREPTPSDLPVRETLLSEIEWVKDSSKDIKLFSEEYLRIKSSVINSSLWERKTSRTRVENAYKSTERMLKWLHLPGGLATRITHSNTSSRKTKTRINKSQISPSKDSLLDFK